MRRLLVRVLALTIGSGVALAGCGAQPPPSPSPSPSHSPSASSQPNPLVGTRWLVVSVGRSHPGTGVSVTLTFDADQVGGFGGCNHFGGRYTYDAPTNRFAIPAPLASTLVLCTQPGVGVFESDYLDALQRTDHAALGNDEQLMMTGGGGLILLAPEIHPAATS